jgi:hypothetical protein
MLGLGRRRDAQAVEAMREQLAAADMHARSVLAAVAKTDSRWTKDREDRARTWLAAAGALDDVRTSAAENTADITRALHHVAEACALVAEKLDADRLERGDLTEAINALKRQLAGSPLDTPSQVLGGMVYAPSPEPTPVVAEIPRNGDTTHNGEIAVNGANGNGAYGNGNGANGAESHGDEIRLADYEDEPVSPFGTIETFRPAEPFRAVEVVEPVAVEPVAVVEPAPERFGAWDAVPPPRPAPAVAVSEPLAPAPVAEPAVVEPAGTYDAFAGLPLLAPAEPAAHAFEPFTPAPVVEEPVVIAPVEPAVVNSVDREWSASHRLTESNTSRPHGGTRLTPRRSTSSTSTR